DVEGDPLGALAALVMSGSPSRATTSPSLMPGARNFRFVASAVAVGLFLPFGSALALGAVLGGVDFELTPGVAPNGTTETVGGSFSKSRSSCPAGHASSW